MSHEELPKGDEAQLGEEASLVESELAAPATDVPGPQDGASEEVAADAGEVEEPPAPLALRQTVSLNGASCDCRFGDEVLDRFGRDLRVAVGRPGRALVVVEEGADGDLVTKVRREATDSGFTVSEASVPSGARAATVAEAQRLFEALAENAITGGDAIVAVGGADALSLCAFAASTWCGGATLAALPTSMDALVRCPARPLALGVGTVAHMVSGRPRMSLCYATPITVGAGLVDDASLLARAYEVSGAVCESKEGFNGLVMRSEAIATGDIEAIGRQALDSARGIGRVCSSTSVAVRQSLAYGETFAEGLQSLAPNLPQWALLGEGMRFSARLAVGIVNGDVDFVFTQDALLDRLGLPAVDGADLPREALDPEALEAAIRAAAFRRSNRYLFAVPYAVGRVRLTAAPEDVLMDNLAGWCASKQQ